MKTLKKFEKKCLRYCRGAAWGELKKMTQYNDHITRQIKSVDTENEDDLKNLWRALDKKFRERPLKVAFWYNGELFDDYFIHQIDITGMRTDIAIALIQKGRRVQTELFVEGVQNDAQQP